MLLLRCKQTSYRLMFPKFSVGNLNILRPPTENFGGDKLTSPPIPNHIHEGRYGKYRFAGTGFAVAGRNREIVFLKCIFPDC